LYVLAMIFLVRPLLRRPTLATALLVAIASAWITEQLGIHALFGALLDRAILPKDESLARHLQTVNVLFLPLFFAVTGLRMNIGLLQTPTLWICCALVLLHAIVGKFGGAALRALTVGFSWRDAAAIGVLMNTRGLMEMVVLNIGRDIGVVSQSLFTMAILMALVTTAMTTPLLDRIMHRTREVEASAAAAA